MPIKPTSVYTQFYNSPLFTLLMRKCEVDTKLIMKLHVDIINTRELPKAYQIINDYLPSVLKSTCYNEYKFPFFKEVLETEVGHLFEHILIEYLCLLKINEGFDEAEYTGLTKWNWKIYSKGTFHITVSAGSNDNLRLSNALQYSISLINTIMESSNKYSLHLQADSDKLMPAKLLQAI